MAYGVSELELVSLGESASLSLFGLFSNIWTPAPYVSDPLTVIFPLGPETAALYLQSINNNRSYNTWFVTNPSGYSVTRFPGSPGRTMEGELMYLPLTGGLAFQSQ
jgi:hypothetical protein